MLILFFCSGSLFSFVVCCSERYIPGPGAVRAVHAAGSVRTRYRQQVHPDHHPARHVHELPPLRPGGPRHLHLRPEPRRHVLSAQRDLLQPPRAQGTAQGGRHGERQLLGRSFYDDILLLFFQGTLEYTKLSLNLKEN